VLGAAILVFLMLGFLSRNFLSVGLEKSIGQLQAGVADSFKTSHRFSVSPKITVDMATDRPWFGWGLGSYYVMFLQYGRGTLFSPDGYSLVLEHAHNDWLETWVEFGALGMFLLLAPIVFAFWRVYRIRPFQPSLFARIVLLGPFLVLVLACWDFPFHNPGVLVHFALVTTLGLRYAELSRGGLKDRNLLPKGQRQRDG
jgi:hypothetical protein